MQAEEDVADIGAEAGRDGVGQAPPKPSPQPSLSDDVRNLVEDGRTFAEAELAFQKSRAAWAGNRVKFIAIFAVLALGFVHLSLVALVVGAVFALAQMMNPWAATGVVTLALLLGAAILGLMIKSKIGDIGDAFASDKQAQEDDSHA
jgi:uncharacterized membrane protein YqjE